MVITHTWSGVVIYMFLQICNINHCDGEAYASKSRRNFVLNRTDPYVKGLARANKLGM